MKWTTVRRLGRVDPTRGVRGSPRPRQPRLTKRHPDPLHNEETSAMRIVRAFPAGWALGLVLVAPQLASAAWDNVFQVTCCHKRPTTAAYYAPPPPCCPAPAPSVAYVQRSYYQPVTTYVAETHYEPVTSYRTSYYYEPVTSYTYSCY